MTIQFPPKVQQAFDNFRARGTFGPEADKTPRDVASLVSFRDNTELVQGLCKLDGAAGDADGQNDDHVLCTPSGLANLGKSGLKSLESQLGGTATAPEMMIHEHADTHDAYHLFTDFKPTASVNTPVIFTTMLTAVVDKDGTAVGSNVIQLKDGKPVMDESGGMEVFANEFLMLK